MTTDPQQASDAALYAEPIAALVAAYGEVPPLWAFSPRVHPMDIHWRMGAGEDYQYLFAAWFDGLHWSHDERVAYVKRWDPPFSWLEHVAVLLWREDFRDSDREPDDEHFRIMSDLGLGTREDWTRCFEVLPEEYPLADDVSSRWLDGPRLL